MSRHDLTKRMLNRIFEYDKETGNLIWKNRKDRTGQWNGRWAGKIAGSLIFNRDGTPYVGVSIDDVKYTARSIVWIMHNGKYPDDMYICSKSGDPISCDINDLYLASSAQAQRVRPQWSSREGKYKGVYKKGNRYKAEITNEKKREYLGLFKTPEDAALAYNKAAIRLFGDGCFLNDVGKHHHGDAF